jgi:hypothetical protein
VLPSIGLLFDWLIVIRFFPLQISFVEGSVFIEQACKLEVLETFILDAVFSFSDFTLHVSILDLSLAFCWPVSNSQVEITCEQSTTKQRGDKSIISDDSYNIDVKNEPCILNTDCTTSTNLGVECHEIRDDKLDSTFIW